MPMYIDPAFGWKYGFPKIYTPNGETMEEWLLANGYPESELDDDGKVYWVRTWGDRFE